MRRRAKVTASLMASERCQRQVGEHGWAMWSTSSPPRPCRAGRGWPIQLLHVLERLLSVVSPRMPLAARSVCSGRPDVLARIFTAIRTARRCRPCCSAASEIDDSWDRRVELVDRLFRRGHKARVEIDRRIWTVRPRRRLWFDAVLKETALQRVNVAKRL